MVRIMGIITHKTPVGNSVYAWVQDRPVLAPGGALGRVYEMQFA
jgi:hypothetical protein